MKNLILFMWGYLALQTAVFSQDIESIFLEFPDELFKIENIDNDHFFTKEVRKICINDEFYLKEHKIYSLDESTLHKKINNETIRDFEDNSMTIKIINASGHLAANYYSENLQVNLDFMLVPGGNADNYSLILLQQYPSMMDNPTIVDLSMFSFSSSTGKYEKKEISFPEFKWEDFLSPEDVKKLNLYYIEDVDIPMLFSVSDINDKSFIFCKPRVSEFVKLFVGQMDHVFEGEQNEMEDYTMTKDSLGFDDVEEPEDLILTVPLFERIDTKEFILMNFFDFFLEKIFKEEKPYIIRYSDEEKKWVIETGNVNATYEFIDDKLDVTTEMNGKETFTVTRLLAGFKSKLLVIYNLSGTNSASRIFLYNITYGRPETNLLPKPKQEWFGIKSDKDVFVELSQFFAPKYEYNNGELSISLIVNPSFGNAEAEKILEQIKDFDYKKVFVWKKNSFEEKSAH